MKRMTRRLLGIVASSAVALPMAAAVQADEMEMKVEPHEHSATVYGSLRYGMKMYDNGLSGSNTEWDTGADYGSRFGIKGSTKVGAGLTAGFQIERGIGADNLGQRFHNVSLSGAFGTIKLGRQGSPYYGATTWDGAAHLGGATDVGDKIDGASIASSLGGPFDFSVLASNMDSDENKVEHIEVSGSLALGPVSLGAGYMEQADDGERFGGTISGTMANITLEMGYEGAKDITCIAEVTDAEPAEFCDEDRYGFNLSYLVGEGPGGGKAYVQYGKRKSDDTTMTEMKRELDYWTLGYSYYVSEAVTVNLVHRTQDAYNKDEGMRLKDERESAVVLKVDF